MDVDNVGGNLGKSLCRYRAFLPLQATPINDFQYEVKRNFPPQRRRKAFNNLIMLNRNNKGRENIFHKSSKINDKQKRKERLMIKQL